jgi:hypothetical protein
MSDEATNNISNSTSNNFMSDEDMFLQLSLFALEKDNFSFVKNGFLNLEKKIIDYIDLIMKKYMNIYIHTDDQTLLISEKNKNNNKIFLKFYFPRVINNSENNLFIDNRINKFGDNIHFTVLPDIFGHGRDGMFHLTFRIESKNGKPIYEYSKYISFNINNEKVGIILYDDEKGNNAVIFRISENIESLKKLILNIQKLSDDNEFNLFTQSESINIQVYKDICLYVALDIFKKLFQSKKIDNFFTRYLNSFGLETIYKMINKLISILLSTFLDLYNNSSVV